jgi:nucleoside-diphosphate kinase
MSAASPVERTCTLIKPDGVCKHLIGTIIDRFEKAGLQLIGLKMLQLSRADAERFYAEHKREPFYEPLVRFMISAPIVAAIWQGPAAIKQARVLIGSTNSPDALPGTLRKQFGVDNRRNLVHGSDSSVSAEREIAFFFKPDELYTYQDTDWDTENLKGKDHGESKKASHRLPTR